MQPRPSLFALGMFWLISLLFQGPTPKPMSPNEFDTYDEAWQQVDSLDRIGQYATARDLVQEIYTRATSENENPQLIKSITYLACYESVLEDKGAVKTLLFLEDELEKVSGVPKAVLQSVTASYYRRYLDERYWQINDRTEMDGPRGADPATWTPGQLEEHIAALFLASVDEPDRLDLPATEYQPVITKLESGQTDYRPTLYDLLAHRAIEYFANSSSYLNEPSYSFYLDSPLAFADAATFTTTDFPTPDTSSFLHRALLLYQDVLAFHADDLKLRLDADLQRMQFVYNQSVLPEKTQYYQQALDEMTETYAGLEALAEVYFRQAKLLYDRGSLYRPGLPNDELRMLWREARDLCREILEQYPNSYGAGQAKSLLHQLESTDLGVTVEEVNLPGQYLLARVNFRNLKQVHFRLVAVDDEIQEKLEDFQRNEWQKRWKYLTKLPVERGWTLSLPQPDDLHEHSTEMGIEALPGGRYLLLSSDGGAFSGEGYSGYCAFQVSGLAVSRRHDFSGSGSEVLVVDRATGTPLEGAKVDVYRGSWNSVSRRRNWKKTATVTTGSDGFATYPVTENSNHRMHVTHQGDVLHTDAFYNGGYYGSDPQTTQVTRFFMDRGIYRPGQTIYFKALLLEKDSDGRPTILDNKPVTITFRDANYQVVEERELRSNEFGTVEGTFIAPIDRLPGQMQLSSSIGGNSESFRVEEYKRPKFEVTLDPVEGDFSLEQDVTVTGKAVAFAGNVLDEATVKYRVVREAQIPWWRRYLRPFNPQDIMEISRGTTTTDADGRFSLTFTAAPDRSIPADQQPIFSYTVYAEVVDGTGETHSENTVVRVGYVSLLANINLPEILATTDFTQIPFAVTNLNGQAATATGTIILQPIEPPLPAMRQRYWNVPDLPVMTEQVFRYRFPDLPFGNEDEVINWEGGESLWTGTFDSGEATSAKPGKINPDPGWYRITLLTEDDSGNAIKAVHHLQLYAPKSKKSPAVNFGWTHFGEAGQLEPGDETSIFLATPEGTSHFLVETVRAGKTINREWVKVKGQVQLEKKITEADRGSLEWIIYSVRRNRHAVTSLNPQIPWSNKELDISFRTFRDKMLPGSKERWEMIIKGPEGAAAAAEMVAAMYDASLDAIVPFGWSRPSWPTYFPRRFRWDIDGFGSQSLSWLQVRSHPYPGSVSKSYRELIPFGGSGYYAGGHRQYSVASEEMELRMAAAPEPQMYGAEPPRSAPPPPGAEADSALTYDADGVPNVEDVTPDVANSPAGMDTQVPLRTNLKETVFFMPELRTDAAGNIILRFTMNEALTKWKFLAFAHTKELEMGLVTKFVQTQKPLMVQPNPPRFFREGDEIEFTAKVVNLSEDTLRGNVHLELVNPLETVPVYKWLDNPRFNTEFTLAPGRSTSVGWRFQVPDAAQVPVIEHTVVAQAGEYGDAERDAVPVLSNRELVTETLPLAVRGGETKTFTLEHLANYESESLSHAGFTLEFTSNPAWYAVQALPYIMEYPHECTEQIFSRYYANSLATSVANSQPRIRDIFESWKGTDAMESPLSRNEELKSALLAETPWVLQAQSEAEQRRNIGLLFDLQRMAAEQAKALNKLQERQLRGGGFAWFPGGRDNWYISQYIVEGFGHLDQLGVKQLREDPASWTMVKSAVEYIDRRLLEHYEELAASVKRGEAKFADDHLDYIVLHYLYARSFFLKDQSGQAGPGTDAATDNPEYLPLNDELEVIVSYYLGQADKYWTSRSQYGQGLIALALKRMGQGKTPALIVKALREQAIIDEELGAYWNYRSGYYWYQHTTETHSLMIELFSEVAQDADMVENLKIWLLKNKQTTHWKTTKATANAVYALLMHGDNWLAETKPVQISLGAAPNEGWQEQITAAQVAAEAGTGYFKTRFDGERVSREMADIRVVNPNTGIAWGGVYWQYLEDLDKIKHFEETPLKIVKQVYRVDLTDRGEQLVPLSDRAVLEPGDKLKVRIELRVDRAMEYVHMKDMRASGFEPIEALSRYKWQEGLGYYESPRDLATDFFISYLPKGTYVFEYPLRVVHRGDFSNGITTIQCMYAPEFTSHSEGIRIRVE